jgi:hypothetical protein
LLKRAVMAEGHKPVDEGWVLIGAHGSHPSFSKRVQH